MLPDGVPRERRIRLPDWLDRALSLAVLPTDGRDVRRTKRLLTGILWASIPTTLLSMIQFAFVEGDPDMARVVILPGAAAVVTLVVVARRPETYPGIAHLPVAITVMVAILVVALGGGFLGSAGNAMWGLVAVIAASAVFADGRATTWFWVYVVGMAAASWIGVRIEPVIDFQNPERAAIFNLVVVSVFVFFLVMYYVRQRAQLLDQSERLLRNILPGRVAERLKEGEGVIADDHPSASVLFADVVGFTPLSSTMSPAEAVGMLDAVFSEIDGLVEQRGLEKIKTVGDEYMVAAGVPEPRDDHAAVLCDLALALQETVRARDFGGHRITLRIGINSGPVVAGIIGVKRFAYDLWGDTVNVASRMETSADPGEIRLTQATASLVSGDYVCEHAGIADIKGKGAMEVWRLVGHR